MPNNPNTIAVTGCDDCPFLEQSAEPDSAFTYCTRSERKINTSDYRNMFAPRAPQHPEWCPLAAGPITVSLTTS